MIPGQGAKIPHSEWCSQKKKLTESKMDKAGLCPGCSIHGDEAWSERRPPPLPVEITGLVSFRSFWQEKNREENMDTKIIQ